MSAGNGSTPPKPAEPFRLDRKTGEVVLTDRTGTERRLRPTMEASEQIETRLEAGMDVLRTRVAAACWPYAPNVAAEPKMVPTSSELAVILLAGLQAGGERGATLAAAKQIIWDLGRAKVVGALFEFTWACSDGGRLREEDLKNEVSPSDSKPEPSGETVEESLITELEVGRRTDDSSE
jgi:hypothetical protein